MSSTQEAAFLDFALGFDVAVVNRRPVRIGHDFSTRMFAIERMYFVPNAGIFAEGRWTRAGVRLLRFFKGVSPAWLEYSKEFPPSPKLVAAKKKQWEENVGSLQGNCDSCGPLGAVCVKFPPAFQYDKPEYLEAVKAGKITTTR